MSQYQDFSSWRPEQERNFVVFEQHSVEAGKKAWTLGAIAAGAAFVLILMVVLGFKPDHSSSEAAVEVDEVGDSLPAERPAPAATPAPAAAPTPAPEPAAQPAADPAAAGAGASGATMPAPPAGATKAPPTALTGQ